MIRFAILTGYLVSVTVLFACGGAEEGRGPVIQPKKEATWVRTEKVQTTTEEIDQNLRSFSLTQQLMNKYRKRFRDV